MFVSEQPSSYWPRYHVLIPFCTNIPEVPHPDSDRNTVYYLRRQHKQLLHTTSPSEIPANIPTVLMRFFPNDTSWFKIGSLPPLLEFVDPDS